MRESRKVRAVAALAVLAAAVAALLTLASVDRAQPMDPLARCASTKGALCDRPGAHEIEAPRDASAALLGEVTVSALRDRAPLTASTADDASFLGEVTVTASRLPSTDLANAESASASRSF